MVDKVVNVIFKYFQDLNFKRDFMQLYLHMDKLVPEKHLLWKDTLIKLEKRDLQFQ